MRTTAAHQQSAVPSQTEDQGTAAYSPAIQSLTNRYAGMRGDLKALTTEVTDGHRAVRSWDLDDRTTLLARRAPTDLLESLAIDKGMAWANIAKLLNVSISALRKWRAGETMGPDNRHRLARLTAFMNLVEEVGPVVEPSGWLAMPLADGYTTTGEDVYRSGHLEDLLDLAAGHIGPRDLLTIHDPDWQRNAVSEWEVVDADDGERLIQRRS